MGNRLMYGNYIDGYDIVDENGAQIYLDYDLELISESLSAAEIDADLSDATYTIDGSVTVPQAKFSIDFGADEVQLVEGAQIGFAFNYVSAIYSGDASYEDGTQPENIFNDTFLFQLQQDFNSVFEMASKPRVHSCY